MIVEHSLHGKLEILFFINFLVPINNVFPENTEDPQTFWLRRFSDVEASYTTNT